MTRQELHDLIDNLTEDELLPAEMHLRAILARKGKANRDEAALNHAGRRTEHYRKAVQERWMRTLKSGMISGLGGGGQLGIDGRGLPNGQLSFNYHDGDQRVIERLQVMSGHELQSIERFSISPDGTGLLYRQELTGGGRRVEREERFPTSPAE